MKAIHLLALGLLVGCASRTPEPPAQSSSDSADFRAVRGVTDRMAAAIRAQNPEQMVANYTREGVSFASHGLLVTGSSELRSLYGRWDSTTTKGTFVEWTDPRIERLGPEAIIMYSRIRLARGNSTGQPTDTTGGTWTGIFVNEAGEWRLKHEHESFERR